MKKHSFLILFFLAIAKLNAQNLVSINFSATLYGNDVTLNDNGLTLTKQTEISKLKFYVSEVKLFNKNKEVYSEKNKFYLVDFHKDETLHFNLKLKNKKPFEEVSFVLGIDSSTNHSGVNGGDLDPTKGMYWAWQSGYINFKLEGVSDLSKAKNNEFALHLGGFLNGNACSEQIKLVVEKQEAININLELSKFLEEVDLSRQNHIMSPGEEAVSVSSVLAKCFSILKNED